MPWQSQLISLSKHGFPGPQPPIYSSTFLPGSGWFRTPQSLQIDWTRVEASFLSCSSTKCSSVLLKIDIQLIFLVSPRSSRCGFFGITLTVSNFHTSGHTHLLTAALYTLSNGRERLFAHPASKSGHMSPFNNPRGFLQVLRHFSICFLSI